MKASNSKNSGIAAVYKSNSTVFTPQELAALWGITSAGYLRTRIHYYIQKGYLSRVYHGLYIKNKTSFNVLEAAAKLRSPSYISLETVLAKAGIVFQKYESVFLVSYASKTITTRMGEFAYKKIKDIVLFDRRGISSAGAYMIASKERAFLDAVYLYREYHFDNLKPLDWKKVRELVPIYKTAAMRKRVEGYKKDAKSR